MHTYRAAQFLPWSLRAVRKFFILFSYWEVPFSAFQIHMADRFSQKLLQNALYLRLVHHIALLYPMSLKQIDSH